jgi:hypothetical protein
MDDIIDVSDKENEIAESGQPSKDLVTPFNSKYLFYLFYAIFNRILMFKGKEKHIN